MASGSRWAEIRTRLITRAIRAGHHWRLRSAAARRARTLAAQAPSEGSRFRRLRRACGSDNTTAPLAAPGTKVELI